MKKIKIIKIILLTIICSQIHLKANAWGNIESKLIYEPRNREIADVRLKLTNPLENTYFYSLDGVKLNAWYIQAKENKPTIVYCHGQGENISLWQSVAQSVIDQGYGIFMLDYRGHGRSNGEPSETGLYLDLESAVKYLKDYKKIDKEHIVLWGRSLGGAVVADIASRDNSYKGVILESAFTNIRDAAKYITNTKICEGKCRIWSRLSTRFIKCFPMTQKYATDEKIHKIKSPLLIAASMNDETVPVHMSYDLANLCNDEQLYICDKGSHHASEWLKPRAIEFLNSLN